MVLSEVCRSTVRVLATEEAVMASEDWRSTKSWFVDEWRGE